MLICNRCNTKNLDEAKFCKECGSNDLYDPQAEEKLEKERQRKEFIAKHKNKIIASVVILFLVACISIYFYSEKYNRIYINELEGKCLDDEASCKILQTIYKEKCDEGDNKACFTNISMNDNLINKKWGFINKKGEIVIEPKFDEVWSFSEGLVRVKLNGKYGFIDKSGKFIIEPRFDKAYPFKEGLAGVLLNGKWGFINKSGEIVIEPKFVEAYTFSEGLAKVKLNGKYGFIDKNGEIVIEPKFDEVWGFSEGLAKVKLNGKWGFINKNGKFVIKPKFDDIWSFWVLK
ncbi:WG repeat-containing protein, partial [Campylobacter sp.]|uniref:WG repeat-containing protein n=1 Tax=Campylobacter sp. TaxID=205 RepID=UPI0025BD3B98